MSIGIWQVILILVIVLIIFGAGKLPKVMGDVAKGVKNFKEGLKDEDDASDQPKVIDQAPPATGHAAAGAHVYTAPTQPAAPVQPAPQAAKDDVVKSS
jgi:sec-independent protein translocase protein TatA